MIKIHPSMSIYLRFLALLNLPIAVLAQSCYNPPAAVGQNGTAQPSTYTTCNIIQAVSMCCRTQEVGGDPADVCLSNGLCSNTQGNSTTYWRESCTDPTWESPYCVAVACGLDSNSNAEMTLCPGSETDFCCGHNNTACCGTSSAIVIAAVDGPFTTSTNTPSPTSPTQTDPTTSISNFATSKGTTTSSGLSGAAKVGIGAGVGAVALIGLLGFGFWIMRRKENPDKAEESVYEKDVTMEAKPAELQSFVKAHEMAG